MKRLVMFFAVIAAVTMVKVFVHPWTAPQTLLDGLSTRYSQNFDQHGLVMGAPSYGVSEWTTLGFPRERLMAAWYYIPRAKTGDAAAREKIHALWLKTIDSFSAPHQSIFSYAQAAAMLVAFPQQLPDLFSAADVAKMRSILVAELPDAAKSTEDINRGVITAVDWTYVSAQLAAANVISEAENAAYHTAFRSLLMKALASCVDGDGWYRENGKLSLHYQAVAAFHLMWYANFEHTPEDLALATKMYTNLRDLSFENGLIEMRFGVRPIGTSAQMALMMGGMANSLMDEPVSTYFSLLRGDRFFQDSRYPNRLEYHSTVTASTRVYEDDLAASGVMMILSAWPDMSLTQPMRMDTVFHHPLDQTIGSVHIINTGTKIVVTDTVQHTKNTSTLRSNGLQTTFVTEKTD